jgi:predicted nucleic acid-binding protein
MSATNLPQELVPATAQQLRRALAMQAQVRVVDGLYVALAEERGCPLLTTDLRLARIVTTCEVLAPPA